MPNAIVAAAGGVDVAAGGVTAEAGGVALGAGGGIALVPDAVVVAAGCVTAGGVALVPGTGGGIALVPDAIFAAAGGVVVAAGGVTAEASGAALVPGAIFIAALGIATVAAMTPSFLSPFASASSAEEEGGTPPLRFPRHPAPPRWCAAPSVRRQELGSHRCLVHSSIRPPDSPMSRPKSAIHFDQRVMLTLGMVK